MGPHFGRRLLFSGVGIVIMALGLTTLTLAGLGTSPVSAPIWVATLAGGLSFGGWTFAGNLLLLGVQLLLLRRNFPLSGWLQIPAVIVLSVMIDLWMPLLERIPLDHYLHQVLQLAVGLVLIGVSVAIQMAADLLYLPGEGVVAAIAKVSRTPFARIKVAFDVTSVTFAGVLSLALFGQIRGLREGTVAAAFVVGIIAGLVSPLVRRCLDHFLAVGASPGPDPEVVAA